MAVTNRGKKKILDMAFRNATEPSNFYVALVSNTSAPTVDANTMSDLSEISDSGGYTSGGVSVARDNTDFDSLTEDDSADESVLQIKDLEFSGEFSGARFAVLTDDNATVASREVLAFWSLGSTDVAVSSGQTYTLQNCTIKATE